MNLREWNAFQVHIFERFHIKETTKIYRLASYLSQFKKLDRSELLEKEIIDEVEKILCRECEDDKI